MANAKLRGCIEGKHVPIPIPKPAFLPKNNFSFPISFVADAAFPFKENIMRPYPGHMLLESKSVFNYRLSRSRRVIENAFGILVSRCRVLVTTLNLNCNPQNAEKVTLDAVALHNFTISDTNEISYYPHKYADWVDTNGHVKKGQFRADSTNLPSV